MNETLEYNLVFFAFAGLIKAKKYDWKDSNMALFGSDTERQVKSKSGHPGVRSKVSQVTQVSGQK